MDRCTFVNSVRSETPAANLETQKCHKGETSSSSPEVSAANQQTQKCHNGETSSSSPETSAANLETKKCHNGETTTHDQTSQTSQIVIPNDCHMRDKIVNVLNEYQDVFDENLHPQGADLPLFHIKLIDDNKIICHPPRNLKPNRRIAVQKQMEMLMEQHIARVVNSEDNHISFASPIVVVDKPDGTIRLCVDYRELNDNTITMEFPLPDIKRMLQCLSGKKFFGKFDSRNGYYQIMLAPEDIYKTGFITPDTQAEFLRLPFGVKNGPPFYQMVMQSIFADMLYKNVVVYFDDVIIFADTEQEYLAVLREVLSRFRTKRLRLKAKKCTLGAQEIEAVGYIVSAQGRRMSEERVKVVRDLPAPTDVSQLRSFLGKVNVFQRFHSSLFRSHSTIESSHQEGG